MVGLVVIDAEEDFDWNTPVRGTHTSTTHMKNVRVLQSLLSAYGIVPTYLLTYPVLEDADVVSILRHQVSKGQCILGVQLHPWVTPPFNEMPSTRHSFPGNLEENQEEQKLIALKSKFSQIFGFDPLVYRAGRYGLGQNTPRLLEKHGFEIDTSVAPRTNFRYEGGRDYSEFDCRPFWFGAQRCLLEIPLCRDVVGWAGPWSSMLYKTVSSPVLSRLHVPSILTRSRCAERVTLSPEGNDVAAMRRLIHGLHRRGQQIFTLSFHSSSLQVGRNPYVQSKAELHRFYDRMSEMLDYLSTHLSFSFVGTLDVPSLLRPPPCPAMTA